MAAAVAVVVVTPNIYLSITWLLVTAEVAAADAAVVTSVEVSSASCLFFLLQIFSFRCLQSSYSIYFLFYKYFIKFL